ncbi:hypothetical protein [Brevibacillus gelatini]
MRKKWLAVGLAVGLTGVLAWGIGGSANADSTGFVLYKSALSQTKEAGSMTAHAQLELTDNGSKLFAVDGVAKVDHEQQLASVNGSYSNANGEGSFQVFRQQDQVVFKKGDSDVYRVMETMGWGRKTQRDDHGEPSAVMSHMHNMLFGEIGKEMTVENLPNGGKQVSLQLSEEQLPMFAKFIGPMVYSKIAEHSQEVAAAHEHGPAVKLPLLQEDVQLAQVVLNATINEKNQIEQQTAKVELVGTDAAGIEHTLRLSVDIRLSDLAATAPEQIDLTGKQVEKITREELRNEWKKGGCWHHEAE